MSAISWGNGTPARPRPRIAPPRLKRPYRKERGEWFEVYDWPHRPCPYREWLQQSLVLRECEIDAVMLALEVDFSLPTREELCVGAEGALGRLS